MKQTKVTISCHDLHKIMVDTERSGSPWELLSNTGYPFDLALRVGGSDSGFSIYLSTDGTWTAHATVPFPVQEAT